MISLDSSRMLYGLGIFLGAVSILYFGQELILGLSPFIKSFVLFCAAGLFLVAPEYLDGDLEVLMYIFSAFSYLSFLVYSFSVFTPSSEVIFLVLAASSALFVSLGYMKNQGSLELDQERARNLIWILAMAVLVGVIFDVTGSQPTYDLQLEESVEVEEGERIKVGTLTVKNDFVFPRDVDVPDYRGCIRDQDRRHPLFFNPDSPRMIGGGETLQLDLEETVRSRHDEANLSGTFDVVNSECPESGEGIYVREEQDGKFVARVD